MGTMISPGPFTLFAPTNAGFAALPSGVIDDLMKPTHKAQLVDILKNHVVQGQTLSSDFMLFEKLTTLQGSELKLQIWGGVAHVGTSLSSKDRKTITSLDNMASNGVMHVIDGVLVPAKKVIV